MIIDKIKKLNQEMKEVDELLSTIYAKSFKNKSIWRELRDKCLKK